MPALQESISFKSITLKQKLSGGLTLALEITEFTVQVQAQCFREDTTEIQGSREVLTKGLYEHDLKEIQNKRKQFHAT